MLRDGAAPVRVLQSCDCSLAVCADVDECRSGSHQCRYNQLCENTRGSYRCVCPRGFRAQGTARPCVGKLPLTPLTSHLCSASACLSAAAHQQCYPCGRPCCRDNFALHFQVAHLKQCSVLHGQS